MKKSGVIKLACLDAIAILLLAWLTNVCLTAKWAFANYALGSEHATSIHLYFKVLVTDNLAFFLFPIFALLFAWAVIKIGQPQKKAKLIALNALVFFLATSLIYVLLFRFGQGTPIGNLLLSLDIFSLPAGIIIVTIVQLLAAALFYQKR